MFLVAATTVSVQSAERTPRNSYLGSDPVIEGISMSDKTTALVRRRPKTVTSAALLGAPPT
jgi:hypothetical protein